MIWHYSVLKSESVRHSVVSDSATPWTVAHQAPPSMGFPRQEYWSGLPSLLQRIFPSQRSKTAPKFPHVWFSIFFLSIRCKACLVSALKWPCTSFSKYKMTFCTVKYWLSNLPSTQAKISHLTSWFSASVNHYQKCTFHVSAFEEIIHWIFPRFDSLLTGRSDWTYSEHSELNRYSCAKTQFNILFLSTEIIKTLKLWVFPVLYLYFQMPWLFKLWKHNRYLRSKFSHKKKNGC